MVTLRGLRSRAVGWALLCAALTLIAPAATAFASAKTVREPAFGLPHIFADTDLELARENGREIAKDRLVQMILLARTGRGTIYQAFGILNPSTLNGDITARRTGYTSKELNNMFAKLPQRERDFVLEYCKGVNDTIDAIYAGTSPEPLEIDILRNVIGLSDDLFGNKNNISDQVDPFYAPPGGEWPHSGFQFTPEQAIAIGVLEVDNFGLNGFSEDQRLAELQKLVAVHGATSGMQIWEDLNFLNDPLAPVSVPDSTTPGFGGPLSALDSPIMLAATASRYPPYDYEAGARARAEEQEQRAELGRSLGAWPALGSYAWIIAANKSATGNPWLGGFPQTGIQTPSIMHYAENRSAEGTDHRIAGNGMEFAGAPFVLIGHTDTVAYTTTTAQFRLIDTFFEQVINEDVDHLRYVDEGTPAPMVQRTETFLGGLAPTVTRVFWRTHQRGGNGGSRPVTNFVGDKGGTADSGTTTTLVDAGAFDGSYVGGYVAIVDGTGSGQIRAISAVPDADTLQVGSPWTTAPDNTSVYVAVKPGNNIFAVALDSLLREEESTTVVGFGQLQRAEGVMDIRAAIRLMPSTHNFFGADNLPFNGVGTDGGNGNIAYFSSGFSRYRLGGQDPRLPLDGTGPNPLVVASGTVSSATATTLDAGGSPFMGKDFTPPAVNYRYQNPTQMGKEYVVAITSGSGAKQSRRIAGNTASSLTVEYPWGVNPGPGDGFEVYQIVAIPEAINPSEGYTSNWNNKAATADEGDDFGRQFRHIFILEQLANENVWSRDKERQLNKSVAGLDGRGDFGRYVIPRLRQAVNAVGNGGNPDADTVLAALETFQGPPLLGRNFIDPVTATTNNGAVAFLNTLINKMAQDIYGDEFSGTGVSVPTSTRAMNMVQHAMDSAAADVPGSYEQEYTGDYFNGTDWRVTVVNSLASLATTPGIGPDTLRGTSSYNHPLSSLFPSLSFPKTPFGNRGTYEQIVEVGPVVNGEFMFPLGQSGLIQGSIAGVTSIDPNFTSLHTIWRDWRFVPMLHVAQDLGPVPDHFMCYKAKRTGGTPKLDDVSVTLADDIESGSADVKRPAALCAPAAIGGEGPRDPLTHLESYLIKTAPAHVPQSNVSVTDEFGTINVDTVKPNRLLVPSVKGLGAPATGQPATNIDHYKCYKVRLSSGSSFADTQAMAADQFENRLYDVKKPKHLCAPVDKNGEGIVSATGHLMCYTVERAAGQPKHAKVQGQIHISNQFASDQRLDTVKEEELCVPATVDGVIAGADTDGDGVLDGYERWYYGSLVNGATSDTDSDGSTLLQEFTNGTDPTDSDTDDDGVLDGSDSKPQDRLTP